MWMHKFGIASYTLWSTVVHLGICIEGKIARLPYTPKKSEGDEYNCGLPHVMLTTALMGNLLTDDFSADMYL